MVKKTTIRKRILYILMPTILLLGISIYWLGFYKQYHPYQIHQNAETVLVLDKKNIAKTFGWQKLQTFDFDFTLSSITDDWNWLDAGIKIPDYICLFKLPNQNFFYFVSEITDEKEFNKTLEHFGIVGKNNKDFSVFYPVNSAFSMFRIHEKLLISNQNEEAELQKIAQELFTDHQFLEKNKAKKIFTDLQHAKLWVKQNALLTQDATVNLSIENHQFTLDGNIQLVDSLFKEQTFSFPKQALASFGVSVQPQVFDLLNSKTKEKLTQIFGFETDSLIKYKPEKLSLNLIGIQPKLIKTVAYEYDDDFNEIEIERIDSTFEPEYRITLRLNQSLKFYDYLNRQNLIDSTNVFVQIPFAKTYIQPFKGGLDFVTENFDFKETKKEAAIIFLKTKPLDSLTLSELPIEKTITNHLQIIDSTNFTLKQNQFKGTFYINPSEYSLISLLD